MTRIRWALSYAAACLTVVAMVLTPFVLTGQFTRVFASLGLHVDDTYSGGEVASSLPRDGYRIDVYRPVEPVALFPQAGSFVQLAWTPADRLPARVQEDVDLDQDGRADLRAEFSVPADATAPMRVSVVPVSTRVVAMTDVSRESFTSLIARVDNRVIVRVPLRAAGR